MESPQDLTAMDMAFQPSQLGESARKQPKYTYYHQQRLKNVFKRERKAYQMANTINNNRFDEVHSNIALIEPPNLADSEACVFSDFKREQNIEEMVIDGATDPTREDGTISNTR